MPITTRFGHRGPNPERSKLVAERIVFFEALKNILYIHVCNTNPLTEPKGASPVGPCETMVNSHGSDNIIILH